MCLVIFESIRSNLSDSFTAMFGFSSAKYWNVFESLAKDVIDHINLTDAAYHNVDHTLQVLQVGQVILEGRHQQCHDITPRDWLNMMVALLCHDVGYVRGICPGDDPTTGTFQTGQGNQVVRLSSQATDASLTPYHVDRGQLYVRHRLSQCPLIDVETVATCIEFTRFPVPREAEYQITSHLPGLCRAADLLGQLSDSDYLKKLSSLFCEFEEIGTNAAMGIESVTDLRANYPNFYWHVVYPYIQSALGYLAVTQMGRQVIARLYTNVHLVELEQSLSDTTSAGLQRRAANNELVPIHQCDTADTLDASY
jgi:hypothetical protein